MIHPYHVGLLHFAEPFGDALLEAIDALPDATDRHGRRVRLTAEHLEITEFDVDFRTRYALVVDRGSHRLPIARGVLMSHAYRGVHVINNPLSFHFFIAHKDVGYAMVRDLGVRVPATFVLPPHRTPGFTDADFRHHRHFDWDRMVDKVGFPCYLKPAAGRGAFGVTRCRDLRDLLDADHASGDESMTLQAAVESPHRWHVRCLCVGREVVLTKFVFRPGDRSEYIEDEGFLTPEQERDVLESCRIINRAFGYEMNSAEFVLDASGRPWAIDFNNPVPDGRREALGPTYFQRYVDGLARRARELAILDRPAPFLPDLNRWSEIARADLPPDERRARALEATRPFYEPPELMDEEPAP